MKWISAGTSSSIKFYTRDCIRIQYVSRSPNIYKYMNNKWIIFFHSFLSINLTWIHSVCVCVCVNGSFNAYKEFELYIFFLKEFYLNLVQENKALASRFTFDLIGWLRVCWVIVFNFFFWGNLSKRFSEKFSRLIPIGCAHYIHKRLLVAHSI